MAGIIVELLISWLLLWFICKQHISVLGLKPTLSRMTNLALGFLIAGLCCTLYMLLATAFVGNSWVINKQVTGKVILESLRWTFISVLYEELIFRGALLYIAIKKLGVMKACIFSAVCFGVYHWFSYSLFGNPVMMAVTFLMTGIVGFSWAFAFAKTRSLYLPIGLHFGWNAFFTIVFSNSKHGQAMFVRANTNQLQGVLSFIVFLFQVFALPAFTIWYLNRLPKKMDGF